MKLSCRKLRRSEGGNFVEGVEAFEYTWMWMALLFQNQTLDWRYSKRPLLDGSRLANNDEDSTSYRFSLNLP